MPAAALHSRSIHRRGSKRSGPRNSNLVQIMFSEEYDVLAAAIQGRSKIAIA